MGFLDMESFGELRLTCKQLHQLSFHVPVSIIIGKNNMGGIPPFPHIRCARFAMNGPCGITLLAHTLRQPTRLQTLDLTRNNLGFTSIEILAPIFPQMTGLQHLNLGYNGIMHRGMKALAPALARMTELQSLDLTSNGIGPKGRSIGANPSLHDPASSLGCSPIL